MATILDQIARSISHAMDYFVADAWKAGANAKKPSWNALLSVAVMVTALTEKKNIIYDYNNNLQYIFGITHMYFCHHYI